MKRLSPLTLTLVALAAFTGPGVAQQEAALENLPGLKSPQTVELPTPLPTPAQTVPPGSGLGFFTFSRCHSCAPSVQYIGGVLDDFGGGNDPVTTSPEMEAYLIAQPAQRRQFDQGGANLNFGHSFQIQENCKVCAVRFEIKMREDLNAPGNDRIFIYGKTITDADLIWTAPMGALGSGAPGTFVLIASLDAPAVDLLNQHIFTNAPGHWLNIFAEDDHAFDYVKLTIFYY